MSKTQNLIDNYMRQFELPNEYPDVALFTSYATGRSM